MCGVAGILSLNGKPVDPQRLGAMNQAMSHRGPDGEGRWLDPARQHVALGHRRLAIISPETGQQPMFNEDGSVAVVFNGEIYNYQDLQPALEAHGHVFRTSSDTEVLVHAYEQWGTDMLARLNGMFAFAIYDQRRQRLLLARDRLGVKPLYYFMSDDTLVFASEMGSMLASGLIPRDIDTEALELYLHYQYIPAPHSIYRQVRKLSPATYLELDIPTRRIEQKTYWNLPLDRSPVADRSLDEWIERLDALLNDAVRIRLYSDVPFGAFLSGGVDSGLVVAMMARQLGAPVHTFSIGLNGQTNDELPYARQVADRYQTQHEEFHVTPEGLTLIPTLAPFFGEPFADSSAVPTWYVSRLAGSRVKMVLTGDGGDEMFGGYKSYSFLLNAMRSGIRLSDIEEAPGGAGLGDKIQRRARRLTRTTVRRMTSALTRNGHNGNHDDHWAPLHDNWMSHFSHEERRLLLGPGARLSEADYVARQCPWPLADSVVARAQYCDLRSYLPGDILTKVDRMTMSRSLEARSPLLDYRVAELAFSMPTSMRIPQPLADGSRNKFVLKELASRYLGRDYVYRAKRGFEIPVSQWLREDRGGYLRDNLLSGDSPLYTLLDKQFCHNLIQRHLGGAADSGAKIWNLLMLDGWLRTVHGARE
ncbi:MAG: asparagine synthase (glutamine-hydrolyzing) [Blastocatellia bacterium]